MSQPRSVCCRVLSLAFLVCVACTTESPVASEPCSTLSIAVGSGLQPTFDWNRACRVEAVVVSRADAPGIVWEAVSVNQTNTISAAVRYAVAPAGAALTANPVFPLASGLAYQITLLRADGGQGSPLRTVGSQFFTP